MHNRKKLKQSKATRIAFAFCGIVITLILLALIGKLGILISESHFDANHQFIVQVKQTGGKSDVVIFAPDAHTISIITLIGKNAERSAIQTIQVPVDATVGNVPFNEEDNNFISHLLFSSLLHDRSTLTSLDALRLLLFSQSVGAITRKSIQLPTDTNNIDSTVTPFATDQTMYKQGFTIAIINASGVSGVGNTIAKLLTHIGGDVISVTTAQIDNPDSKLVYAGKMSYSVTRLSGIFAIPSIQTSNPSIADITITIGEDKGKTFVTNL